MLPETTIALEYPNILGIEFPKTYLAIALYNPIPKRAITIIVVITKSVFKIDLNIFFIFTDFFNCHLKNVYL